MLEESHQKGWISIYSDNNGIMNGITSFSMLLLHYLRDGLILCVVDFSMEMELYNHLQL